MLRSLEDGGLRVLLTFEVAKKKMCCKYRPDEGKQPCC